MNSVCQQCRAAGEKLYLKGEKCVSPKCPFTRRPYGPGQAGPGKQKRPDRNVSDFARQLRGKQEIKKTYLMRERQLRRLFDLAARSQGPTGERLLAILELRLDSLIFKAGLRPSRGAARQAVSHGHVTVNQKPVSIPSYIARIGDLLSVKTIPEGWTDKNLPEWLESTEGGIKLVRLPTREELPPFLDEQALVEYYSR